MPDVSFLSFAMETGMIGHESFRLNIPSIADDISAANAGARFHRADLHVHSHGGSHAVSDLSMTPANIVDTAIAQGLAVIAVTDHNEITNIQITITAAYGRPLFVLPGVELTTPQRHLLVYFGDLAQLTTFYGRLEIVDRGTPNSRCQMLARLALSRARYRRLAARIAT